MSEKDLEQRGVPADIVEKCFLGLHRCDELPPEVWIGMITDAYNLATAIAAAPWEQRIGQIWDH